MKLYIAQLIPRLKSFSENLDRKEIFIEIPWVIIDENLNQQKYIFKRNGDLIMSLNGQVTIGKWEYFATAKSLLIDRIQDKILLNQNFIDPVVMILKKDGTKEENLILANENLLPDLDIASYLKKLYYKKNNITIKQLKSGEFLELNSFDGIFRNKAVTIDGNRVPDTILEIENSNSKYVIKDSRIIKILVMEEYTTDKGIIFIEQEEFFGYSKGNYVYQNSKLARDGRYRLGFLKHITISNGRII